MSTTAKEYNILFKLQAQVTKEFAPTFAKAQQAFRETERAMQQLNKMQGDVAAYQRQQQAVENTTRKLTALQQQHDNLQREMQESTTYSATLENKMIDKQQAIEKATQALERQTEKMNAQKAALQEAGIDTSRLEDESKRLAAEYDTLAQKNHEAAEQAVEYQTAGVDAFQNVAAALSATGLIAGIKAVADEYAECVKIAADFQETMSTVEALSGASAAEMQALSEQAKALGATTKFTASESAEAMTYMGMAGWSAEQMIAGMDGVLSLAAASGEDLALTSDIVTDSLTAFGLRASDTAHFADVLAAAATNSNTSVSVMGETFKQSASIAGALGYSIEDVSTAIGLMANAGVKGSIAGTALKNTFNGLLEGATLSSEAFGEVKITAVSADGTMKSFGETITELRGYFNEMTEAERVNNAMAIAGQRGYNGLLAIVNSTDEDFRKLTNSINNCTGAASRMAKTRMDNFNGQVTLMNSAMDALKTTLGETFQDELKELAGIATDALTTVNDFMQANPELTKGIVLLGGAIGATGAAFGAYTTVKNVIDTLKQFKIAANLAASAQQALNFAVSAAPYALAGVALIAFIDGINSLSERTERAQEHIAELTDEVREYTESAKTAVEEQKQLENVVEEYERISTTVTDATEKKEALAELQQTLNELYDGEKNGIDLVNGSYEEQIAKLEELTDIQKDYRISEITKQIEEAHAAIAEAEAHQIPVTFDWSGTNEQFEDELNTLYKQWQEAGKGVTLSGGRDNERNLLIEGDIREQIELLEQMQQAMRDSGATGYEYADSFQYITDKLEDLYTLRDAPTELQTEIDKLNGVIADSAAYMEQTTGISCGLHNALMAVESGYLDIAAAAETYGVGESEIKAAIASAKTYQSVLQTAAGTVVSGYQSAADAAEKYGVTVEAVEISAKIQQDIKDIQELAAAYDEALAAAEKSVEGQYKLWDDAAEIVAQDIDAINSSLMSQSEHWKEYNDNIATLSAKANDIEGLREVIATFADGSPESANMIAGLAQSSDEDLKKMVANWQSVQEEQRLTSEALAELTTGAGKDIAELQEELDKAVEALNIEDEAGTAAKDSIDAYVQAIKDGEADAVAAAERISALVAAALNPNTQVITLPDGTAFSAANMPSIDELIADAQFVGPRLPADWSGAYAGGTDGAKAGLALVGENGPELVRLAGGEQIFTAEQTREILREIKTYSQYSRALEDISEYAAGTGAQWDMNENGAVPQSAAYQHAPFPFDTLSASDVQMIAILPELLKQYREELSALYGNSGGIKATPGGYPIYSSDPTGTGAMSSALAALPFETMGGASVNVNLNIHAERNGSIDDFAEFLEGYLSDYSEELTGKVLDALEEYEIDRRRRVYK
ncbi:MAG: phage tail tape measure protein [Ruminiclostridium sp.]|uniref:phage tail tape measure protein n=1 Tax=Ruminococcus sp. TaxID=41978 RepID=UPI0025D55BE3|nr:phage tail tape measure protein [Ruminococcus sp.]MBR1433035.1 phage tail tape measure protein [Ruminococcus sp.]MBR1831058.1 phage tail tape measure protein [Ruminiclostridium sp.]